MSVLKVMNTPVFAAEGVQHLDHGLFRLSVSGLTAGDRTFSLAELKAEFPAAVANRRMTSVSGWSVRADWAGVSWADFLSVVRPREGARYALFTSAGDYTTCALLSDLAASQTILAWGVSGEALEDEYGGPLRVIAPNLWGYKSCKWLTKIAFVDKYVTGYWELRGYPHRGEIEPGDTFDVNSQQRRPITGGEVTEF
jgi:DMSO/TMAO reductase YedYZ molybdopterin-dependent catalytic subunit